MAVPLDEQTVKRLAYIRMLYEQGVGLAKQPLPMGASSLLSLHDAVEMFLVLAGGALNEPVDKSTRFLDFWKKIKSVQLSQGHAMQRLNDARNSLKHAGLMPSQEIVEQGVADTFAFFDDNVPKVFGVTFWSVDTSHVIPQDRVRKWTRQASERFEAGEGGAALALLQLALREVLADDPATPYRSTVNKLSRWRPAMRDLPRTFSRMFDRSPFSSSSASTSQGLRELVEAVDGLQEAVRWMALGGNLHQYARFQSLTPSNIWWAARPEENEVERVISNRQEQPTREEFDFCRQFVVTTALRQADNETHAVPPSWLPPEPKTFGSS